MPDDSPNRAPEQHSGQPEAMRAEQHRRAVAMWVAKGLTEDEAEARLAEGKAKLAQATVFGAPRSPEADARFKEAMAAIREAERG